jgi:hypothetical protein
VLLLIVALILALSWSLKEGFDDPPSAADLVTDRGNTLAANTPSMANPAVPIGITTAAADAVRDLYTAAFGDSIQPRIDDQNSFLGMVKYCKDNGSGSNPFSDSTFADNCGVCTSSGAIILADAKGTATTFDKGPMGVLVYKADKEKAITNQQNNGDIFPHVIPSLKAAFCNGASTGKDAQPVLAINAADFDKFTKRMNCQLHKEFSPDCGQCVNPQTFTYFPKATGGRSTLSIALWGAGAVIFYLGGVPQHPTGASPDASGVYAPDVLNDTKATMYELGTVAEGTSVEFKVMPLKGSTSFYLYGALVGVKSNKKPYILSIDDFIERDNASNTLPSHGSSNYFQDIKKWLKRIVPKYNATSMDLVGAIPVTLVQADELATYDCGTSPLTLSQATADMMIDDPCRRPVGQGPGNYSDECLKQTITGAGCSASGTWYKDPGAVAGNMSIGAFTTWIQGKKTIAETDVDAAKGCLGNDLKTPCDDYLTGDGATAIPSSACMKFIYTNASQTSRLGPAYTGVGQTFSSLNGKTIQFCQVDGNLNPEKTDGLARLTEVARGNAPAGSVALGKRGLEAVKSYLSEVYAKATNINLNVNKFDNDPQGGRRDSWADGFGMPIADPKLGSVQTQANGTVQDPKSQCNPALPGAFNPRSNTRLGTVQMTGNYTLAFTIKPTATSGAWTNIIRFHLNSVQLGDCCGLGQRSPSIWFIPNTLGLHVRIGDATDGNWGINTEPILMGQLNTFRLVCDGRSVSLTINSRTYTATQPSYRAYGTATVWGSDPWFTPAQAAITGLCYTAV